MQKLHITQDQVDRVVSLFSEGMTQMQIADVIGFNKNIVVRILKERGLRHTPSKKEYDESTLSTIRQMRKRGESLESIAAAVSMSASNVFRIVKRYGFEEDVANIDHAKVRALYASGLSMERVGASMGLTTRSVRNIVGDDVRESPIKRRVPVGHVDLPPFVDSKEWFEAAYAKYGLPKIAKFIGRSTRFVTDRLNAHGIPRVGRNRHNPEFVVKMYREVGSMVECARRLGYSIQGVKNVLLRCGIEPSTTSQQFSGSGNPFWGKTHTPETAATCAKIGAIEGKKWWRAHPEYADVVRRAQRTLWSDERREWFSKLISQMRADGRCVPRRGTVSTRFGDMAYDSSYELRLIEFCESDDRILSVERDFDMVGFEFGGRRRIYIPDFRIVLKQNAVLVVEVKSAWMAAKPKEIVKMAAGHARYGSQFMVVGKDLTNLRHRIDMVCAEPIVDFDALTLRPLLPDEYLPFYASFHYMGKSRRSGWTFGAVSNEKIIASATFSNLTRIESARRMGVQPSSAMELIRFCIHPEFHARNLGSWFMAKAIHSLAKEYPSVGVLLTFADPAAGHTGALYKASNWSEDGWTRPSYFYVDKNGNMIHKKTVYERAVAAGLAEAPYAEAEGLLKQPTPPKQRFVYKIHR